MKIIVSCAFALALLGSLAFEAAAQTSCSGWNATCKGRCSGDASCARYCAGQMAACKQSGCWTEGAKFGGAKHCSLQKK